MTETQETLHFLDYWRIIQSRKEIVIAVSLLVVLTGVIITYSMPKVYRSSVVIQVKKESPDVAVFKMEAARYDPLFLRTQYEIIQSDPILEEVIRRRDLCKKFSKAYGYENMPQQTILNRTLASLKESLSVQQYRDTELIEIQILFDEPEGKANDEAAQTANMIADVYREQNMKRSRYATEKALSVLYDALEEQRKKVDEAENEVERIRVQYQISETILGYDQTYTLNKRSLEQMESERVRLSILLADRQSKLNQVKALSLEKLLVSARTLVGDVVLDALVAERSKVEVQLSQHRKSYGPKHPEVLRVEAAVKELDLKITKELMGLRTSVKAEYDQTEATLTMLKKEIDKAKKKEINAEGSGYREFETAKEKLTHFRLIRNSLEERHVKESIEMRIPRTTVEVIEPAKVADEKDFVSPRIMLNIILSVIMGIGCGITLAYFIEYMDTSVKTIKDVEDYLSVPVIGIVPQKVDAFSEEGADAVNAEAYRMLRTNIQFSKRIKESGILTVTSGSVGEGKSLTTFNLGYVCASLGDSVLIVDADLHRPRQHKMVGVSNSVGLANVLAGAIELEDAIIATDFDNLDFLPSGKMSYEAHGLLDTRMWKNVVAELRANYDVVLLDAPPIIGVSDTSLVVREADGVLLVIQHRKYPKSVSIRARDMIENMGATIVGVVMNNINISRDYYYYYPSGSKYYYGKS